MKKFFICFLSLILLFYSAESIHAEQNTNSNNTADSITVSAESAILINAFTGNVIYEKNISEVRAVASTTKIMTALLTIEAGNLDKTFTVDSYAIKVEGTSMGLREGDVVTRRSLCYGMMLPSGNDAANASAVSVSGSLQEFVELMNEKASKLGMKNTKFANPSGLDAKGHYSTAYDMAILMKEALKNPIFKEICGTKEISLEYGNPPYSRTLKNNNKLLNLYNGCLGGKTGFTDNARRCLVSFAEKDGVIIIAVTLNAPDDWNDHARMFDYGFSHVKNQPVSIDENDLYVEVISSSIEKIKIKPSEELLLPLTEDEMRYVEIKSNIRKFIYSGFDKGEFAGELIVYYNGDEIKKIPLITVMSCYEDEVKLNIISRIINYIRKLI